jgi:NADH:ubiquinone oxidoreductase subunit E
MDVPVEQLQRDLESLFASYEPGPTNLIPILHELQNRFGHVPRESIRLLARALNLSESEIYGVATFYSHFRLAPIGRHHITVCRGTTCHVEQGPRLLDELRRLLHISPGERTADRQFSLSTVPCFGCCAAAPVMMIDGQLYPHVTPAKLAALLTDYGFSAARGAHEAA